LKKICVICQAFVSGFNQVGFKKVLYHNNNNSSSSSNNNNNKIDYKQRQVAMAKACP